MKLSVSLITYNHEEYLAQSIESILNQKTDFDFELVIGEDCSKDNSRQICLEYKEKYPDKIRLILHDDNVGILKNFLGNISYCKGEYVALLEGDDYWIDEYKLQKQVDALEADVDKKHAFCFHNVKLLFDENVEGNNRLYNSSKTKETYVASHLIENDWFAHTSSLMIRNGLIDQFPEVFYTFKSGDIPLGIYLSQFGSALYLPDVMSVYRKNEGGITIKRSVDYSLVFKEYIRMYGILDKEMQFEYADSFKKMIAKQYLNLLKWNVEKKEKGEVKKYMEICKTKEAYYSPYQKKQLLYLSMANKFPFLITLWQKINTIRN